MKTGAVFPAVVFVLVFLSLFFAQNSEFVTRSVGRASSFSSAACKEFFVVVDSLEDEAAAKRLQTALSTEDVVLDVRRSEGFVSDARALEKRLSGLDYEELTVIILGGVEADRALLDPALLARVAKTYFSELGTLQYVKEGHLTPGLQGLVDEGILFPWQAERLRAGVPLVMGGLHGDDARRLAFWQLRDYLVDYGADYFISNPSSDALSFTFGTTHPAYDIILTKDRWNEFVGKHITGTYIGKLGETKTVLPVEFKNTETRKELLNKILKLVIREKGKAVRGGKYRLIEKDIVIKGYVISWVIGIDVPTATLVELYPRSIRKIALIGGR